MAYTKNTWTDRVSPLSATRLNNLETQYDQVKAELGNNTGDLWTQIKSADGTGSGLDADLVRGVDVIGALERNTYDDYLRTMELYYTGHFSGPAIDGMKGMTFDGFMDTSRINAAATDAVVETVDKIVRSKLDIFRPTVVSKTAVSTLQDTSGAWSNISNQIDTNPATYSYFSYSDSADFWTTFRYDLGSIRSNIRSLSVRAKRTTTAGDSPYKSYITRVAYSSDGTSWTVIDITDIEITRDTITEHVVSLPIITARYIAVEYSHEGFSTTYSATVFLYDVNITAGYLNSILQTTTKQLDSNIATATLYISGEIPSGASYVPSIYAGANFVNMPLIANRTDPLDGNYIEYKHQVDIANIDNSLILKINLNTDGAVTPKIKRYGLFWA